MKKTIARIIISLLVSIAFFLLSINYIFKIPSPTGGYEMITYQVGAGLAIVAGGITALLLFVLKKSKKK
jgi:hypothetical protein